MSDNDKKPGKMSKEELFELYDRRVNKELQKDVKSAAKRYRTIIGVSFIFYFFITYITFLSVKYLKGNIRVSTIIIWCIVTIFTVVNIIKTERKIKEMRDDINKDFKS